MSLISIGSLKRKFYRLKDELRDRKSAQKELVHSHSHNKRLLTVRSNEARSLELLLNSQKAYIDSRAISSATHLKDRLQEEVSLLQSTVATKAIIITFKQGEIEKALKKLKEAREHLKSRKDRVEEKRQKDIAKAILDDGQAVS